MWSRGETIIILNGSCALLLEVRGGAKLTHLRTQGAKGLS